MKQKKLLILNGSHSDVPLIKAGKDLGYYVITTGNNPGLIGHRYSDEYVCADYSDFRLIELIAREKQIDAICSCANDFGAITAAYVAEMLALPGHDSFNTTLRLHHKDLFKALSKEIGLLTPAAENFDNEKDAVAYANSLDYPVMIKPIDLTGGKGISKALTREEKIAAVHKAISMSPHKRIVIERFIEGSYHSFDTFLVNGKVRYRYSDNEYFNDDPIYCKTSAGPADRISEVERILISECEKLASTLQLVDGKLHMQYVLDKAGNPHVLEYTRRCCGDLYCVPVEHATGVDVYKYIVKAECGLDVSDCPSVGQSGFTGRHCVLADRNGVIEDVRIDDRLRSCLIDELYLWNRGMVITNHAVERLGVISYSFTSRSEMMDVVDNLSDLIHVYYQG
jgi:biotin carboxylase